MTNRRLFRLALVSTALACSGAAAKAETVTLRADLWCPYNCAPDAEKPGYAIEIAREAFGKAGIKVDYQILNWGRSIEDARSGLYDGIVGASPDDAPDFVFPKEPVGLSGEGYAVRKGETFHLEGPQSFSGKVMGAVSSYGFSGIIGSYIGANKDDRSKVQLTSGDDALAQNFEKLKAGRIDIVMDDVNVLAHTIETSNLGEQVTIADQGKAVPVFIAFSPTSPKAKDYAALLDKNIAEMRASGRLGAILKRYNVAN